MRLFCLIFSVVLFSGAFAYAFPSNKGFEVDGPVIITENVPGWGGLTQGYEFNVTIKGLYFENAQPILKEHYVPRAGDEAKTPEYYDVMAYSQVMSLRQMRGAGFMEADLIGRYSHRDFEKENLQVLLTLGPTIDIGYGPWDRAGVQFFVKARCYPGRPGNINCNDEKAIVKVVEEILAENRVHKMRFLDHTTAPGLPDECPNGC